MSFSFATESRMSETGRYQGHGFSGTAHAVMRVCITVFSL